VWINAHNMFDAAAGFGGYKRSGFGRDGGREGLREYVAEKWKKCPRVALSSLKERTPTPKWEADTPHCALPNPSVDRTFKLFIGGAQKRPDGGYGKVAYAGDGATPYALVPSANRKDMRDAVAAALKAQPGWANKTGFLRSQILYYLAENLQQRSKQLTEELMVSGSSEKEAAEEVAACVRVLFRHAATADKYGGEVKEVGVSGGGCGTTVIAVHEPIGVIGMVFPETPALLPLVASVAAALSRGNAVVCVVPQRRPTAAMTLYQVIEASDVPAGVLNLLSGPRRHLASQMALHDDVGSVWAFANPQCPKEMEMLRSIEFESASNLKRTWCCREGRNWLDTEQGAGKEFLEQATHVKNIWMTGGETFAN